MIFNLKCWCALCRISINSVYVAAIQQAAVHVHEPKMPYCRLCSGLYILLYASEWEYESWQHWPLPPAVLAQNITEMCCGWSSTLDHAGGSLHVQHPQTRHSSWIWGRFSTTEFGKAGKRRRERQEGKGGHGKRQVTHREDGKSRKHIGRGEEERGRTGGLSRWPPPRKNFRSATGWQQVH